MADGYVMSRELKDAIQVMMRQYFNSFQARPKSERRPDDGFGGSSGTSNLSSFAIVTEQADADLGSIGKAVLMELTVDGFVPVDVNGDPLILDSGDPGYDAGLVADAEIEFKTADYCDNPVGWRVQLWSTEEIVPGSVWDEKQVAGTAVLPPCQTATFLTDVSCVDDEIVGEDDDIETLECLAERSFPPLPE